MFPVSGIIQYVAFGDCLLGRDRIVVRTLRCGDCLLSLGMLFSRSVRDGSRISTSLLFVDEQ